jgi:hypothetical protein
MVENEQHKNSLWELVFFARKKGKESPCRYCSSKNNDKDTHTRFLTWTTNNRDTHTPTTQKDTYTQER